MVYSGAHERLGQRLKLGGDGSRASAAPRGLRHRSRYRFRNGGNARNGLANGCVVIGTNAYQHDQKVPKTDSHWACPVADQLLTSTLGAKFTAVTTSAGYPASVEALLIPVPKNAAATASVNINVDFVAVTEINVTISADYAAADQAVLDAYPASNITNPVGSLETTLGVIRACFRKPGDPRRALIASQVKTPAS